MPADLVDYAEKKAEGLYASKSQVIAEALGEKKAREEEDLAAEGYRFYAEEAQDFAAASLGPTSEAIRNAG